MDTDRKGISTMQTSSPTGDAFGFAEEAFCFVLIRVHLCPSVVKDFSAAWMRLQLALK
jgi:hypothetical protein